MTFDFDLPTTIAAVTAGVTAAGGLGTGGWILLRVAVNILKLLLVFEEKLKGYSEKFDEYVAREEKERREFIEWARNLESRISALEEKITQILTLLGGAKIVRSNGIKHSIPTEEVTNG